MSAQSRPDDLSTRKPLHWVAGDGIHVLLIGRAGQVAVVDGSDGWRVLEIPRGWRQPTLIAAGLGLEASSDRRRRISSYPGLTSGEAADLITLAAMVRLEPPSWRQVKALRAAGITAVDGLTRAGADQLLSASRGEARQ